MKYSDLDAFTLAYIEAALWSSSDEYCEECLKPCGDKEPCEACGKGTGTSEPMDDNHSWSDIAPDALAKIVEDCKSFQETHSELLGDWYQLESIERAGHDFWLTRNRHGAGYWDRFSGEHDMQPIGKQLTDAAHAYGECSLYVGDDELIHIGG